ncbi:MAG: RNA polymerase sigma factor region1.1 domain-containing protein [Pyrinomonadaceae bacterium]
MEEKDQDDVMHRLLELGGDKKYLTFDDLNRELPDSMVSPEDIEDVLQKLEGSNIPLADSDERLIEQAAATPTTDEESENGEEDAELDLSAGTMDKPTTPCAFTCARWASCRCSRAKARFQSRRESSAVKSKLKKPFHARPSPCANCFGWATI